MQFERSKSTHLLEIRNVGSLIVWFYLKDKHFSEPEHKFDEETCDKMNLAYYSTSMHQSAFVIPRKFSKVSSRVG